MKNYFLFINCLLLLVFASSTILAQETITLEKKKYLTQRVNIGEKCPDFMLEHLMNYSKTSTKISDFKGKLLLIDFWSTGCAGCIQAFPEMEALQKRFTGKLQIMLVNYQSEDSTKHFFASRKRLKLPQLPMVSGDTNLHKAFPHIGNPLHVWIDQQGIVKAITDGDNATPENIQKVLEGKKTDFIVSIAENLNVDTSKPEIANLSGRSLSNVQFISYLMSPSVLSDVANVGSYNGEDEKNHNANRIFIGHSDIAGLFVKAYGEDKPSLPFDHFNCVFLDVADTSSYRYPNGANRSKMNDFMKNHTYTYDLRIPVARSKDKYKIMQQDVERYFNAKGFIEKRKVLCWVLIRTDSIDRIASKGGIRKVLHKRDSIGDRTTVYTNSDFKNVVWNTISSSFRSDPLSGPFVDDTNYTGKVDMRFFMVDKMGDGFHTLDPEGMRACLRPYGLDLKQEYRMTDVLVIRENDYRILKLSK